MDKTLVMKFGGTSVGNVLAMRQAVQIIQDARQSWENIVVVISALSGVTDLLIGSATLASRGDISTSYKAAEQLNMRHLELVDALVSDFAQKNQLHQEIDHLVNSFSNLCQAINVLGEATPRALDAVVSLGERLSVRVFAAALESAQIQSQFIESTHLIATDSRYQNAHPDMNRTRQQVEKVLLPVLANGRVPVVTGFIAADAAGITTTLGRGGSDYSASILAVALKADEVWIWTDVDGVMTADPRLVPNARTIPELSFREVAEMAYFGAKVLHPKSIQPVIDAGIALRVCNTFNPAKPGTRLFTERKSNGHGTIKALAAITGLRLITLSGTGMLGVPGVAGKIFSAVATTGVSIPLIIESSSEQAICFPVPKNCVEDVLNSLYNNLGEQFQGGDIDHASTSEDVDIITVVCPNLLTTPGIAGKIFSTLGEAGINVLGISFGASEVSVNLILSAADTRSALNTLHNLIIQE